MRHKGSDAVRPEAKRGLRICHHGSDMIFHGTPKTLSFAIHSVGIRAGKTLKITGGHAVFSKRAVGIDPLVVRLDQVDRAAVVGDFPDPG